MINSITPIVHVYIVCYNEEEILKNILDYYTSLATKIFLFDNLSDDNTTSIASKYESVKVIPFDTNGQKDNTKHIHIKTQAYKDYSRAGGMHTEEVADWIICIDTDEVIYTPNLLEVLQKYKEEGVTVPQITAFDMTGDNEIDPNKSILVQYPNGIRRESFDKCAIFDVEFDMSYRKGCHPYGAGHELMKETFNYVSSNKYPIALLHYKDIGSLLYNSAVKNHSRFAEIKTDLNGNYYGPGSQYAFFKDKGSDFSPYKDKAKAVITESLNILFDDFSPSKSDSGYRKIENKIHSLPSEDINKIRDYALKVEKYDMTLALELMELAKKYRKDGAGILAKIDSYKKILNQ